MKNNLIRIASRNQLYEAVANMSPGRTKFDLSHRRLYDCYAGQIIPICIEEAYPGDIFNLGIEAVIRCQPMVAPILGQIDYEVVWFFEPNSLLMDDWADFITGGIDGEDVTVLPKWSPTNNAKYSLWDYCGFPVGVVPAGMLPVDFVRRGYNHIWNMWYKDENVDADVDLTNESILRRRWDKDYFTASLPWRQRGVSPVIPLGGVTSAVFTGGGSGLDYPIVAGAGNSRLKTGTGEGLAALNANTVDLSTSGSVSIHIIREQIAIQKWQERNARCGGRYNEFVKAHFGVQTKDSRYDRPEYICSVRAPIVFSEVLQTSKSEVGAPQGNLAGHGLGVTMQHGGSYRVTEHGFIWGLATVVPKADYQQGMDCMYTRETRYDYYSPEFANLSEKVVHRGELYATDVEADNLITFGYQGIYDELRTRKNVICANMRDTLDYWHVGRQFTSYPELNSTFLEINMRNECFAVQNVPNFIIHAGHICTAIRPMPYQSVPGGLLY